MTFLQLFQIQQTFRQTTIVNFWPWLKCRKNELFEVKVRTISENSCEIAIKGMALLARLILGHPQKHVSITRPQIKNVFQPTDFTYTTKVKLSHSNSSFSLLLILSLTLSSFLKVKKYFEDEQYFEQTNS